MRLSIYVPDSLGQELETYRSAMNLSQVCADALRDALTAMTSLRDAGTVFARMYQGSTRAEQELERRLGVAKVVLAEGASGESPVETVAAATARQLDRVLADGVRLGIGGGPQMWATVRRLLPRSAALELSAIGFAQVDMEAPHLHANALVTLASLLYAPRSSVVLTGSPAFAKSWDASDDADVRSEVRMGDEPVRRVVVGSCGAFSPQSAYARLLGEELSFYLYEEQAVCEFLGVFLTADGRVLEPYMPAHVVNHVRASDLQRFAQRKDTLVVLSATSGKMELVERVAGAGLCNVVVMDGKRL